MTTIQRLKSTRVAPYIGLIQELTPEERHLLVMFLTEQEEPKAKRQVPAEFKKLRGIVNITEEDMARDEHLAHIMGR
jgi:hypothetical protein